MLTKSSLTKSSLTKSSLTKSNLTKLAATAALCLTTALPSASAIAEEVTIKLWSRADRSGPLRAGNIVKAAELLSKKLAAAGVKVRQGTPDQAVRFADAAATELDVAEPELDPSSTLSIDGLRRFAQHVREHSPRADADPSRLVEVVFGARLESSLAG